ncbi:hypothetical protein KEM54_001100 [Ascosphaera aggregata]|nr:hypothetical protein KEM54_001100 [Ascosphaera aggregata]
MGKVHGSLARAGKVKSQTPKDEGCAASKRRWEEILEYKTLCNDFSTKIVEPQEKAKTPKGRAYKRLLYTRRFVNVTMTGGKRRMNPAPSA